MASLPLAVTNGQQPCGPFRTMEAASLHRACDQCLLCPQAAVARDGGLGVFGEDDSNALEIPCHKRPGSFFALCISLVRYPSCWDHIVGDPEMLRNPIHYRTTTFGPRQETSTFFSAGRCWQPQQVINRCSSYLGDSVGISLLVGIMLRFQQNSAWMAKSPVWFHPVLFIFFEWC